MLSRSDPCDPSLKKAWKLYLPEEEEIHEDPKYPIVVALSQFLLESHEKYLNLHEIKEKHRCSFDYSTICEDIPISDFSATLKEEPFVVITCFKLAIFKTLCDLEVDFDFHRTPVRILNYNPLTQLKNLKSNLVEKFVSFRGTVIRVGNIKPLVIEVDFDCPRCGGRIHRFFHDGRYNPPQVCITPKCRNKTFDIDRDSAVTLDWQSIKLQEILDNSSAGSDIGRIPRTIECELSEDLVGSCVPGDIVTVAGIVKAVPIEAPGKKDKNKSLFVLYLDVNSFSNANGSDSEHGCKNEIFEFVEKDIQLIQEISSDPDILKTVVNSICPAIYGHEIVKLGLSLTLFGGCQKFVGDKNKLVTRGDPHILIVGDPGMGKSQLLRGVTALSPRGVYVCGNTTSTAGLTVTMVREASDYVLEAGALVLGDQGVCCIDEFDKMTAEHSALLEAMEQQTISIAKAGIVCSLSAQTSVVAAANPVGGHYNRSKTVNENLKMSPAILSRFDLCFIILDNPDEFRDQLLSEHIIALHSDSGAAVSQRSSAESKDAIFGSCSIRNDEKRLEERVKMTAAERPRFIPIPVHILRKYIAYARKYIHPRLSLSAQRVLQQFYLNLRQNYKDTDHTPITTRQLESMIRLSEARAKIELREIVTERDALDVVEVMKDSLFDTLADEFGNVDFGRSSGMSKSKKCINFMRSAHRYCEHNQTAILTRQELLQISKNMGLQHDNFDLFIDTLNQQNFLLQKKNGYLVQSSNFSQ